MKSDRSLLYAAWTQLALAYVIAFGTGLAAGTILLKIGPIRPENLFELSSKRLSYALPVFELGARHGIDQGVLLFAWNAIGALITLSFIYAAAWFNPDHLSSPPRALRRIFCGKTSMKLLCHLPGCGRIEAESLRRMYVWVMVPMLGIILLGMESGLQVSTAAYLFGSFFSAAIALLPHGMIEIPALALAGAVPYSANLLIRQKGGSAPTSAVFQLIERHTRSIPIRKIAWVVIGGLFLAGLIEAHVTPQLMAIR